MHWATNNTHQACNIGSYSTIAFQALTLGFVEQGVVMEETKRDHFPLSSRLGNTTQRDPSGTGHRETAIALLIISQTVRVLVVLPSIIFSFLPSLKIIIGRENS